MQRKQIASELEYIGRKGYYPEKQNSEKKAGKFLYRLYEPDYESQKNFTQNTPSSS